MSRSAAALAHERAGRVQLDSVGLRVSEPTAVEAGPTLERGFAIGSTRLGALELEVVLETQGGTACVHLRANNRSDRAARLDAAVLSLRWTGHGLRSHRYLRHGWQSWSHTSARALDAVGPEVFRSGPWLRGFHHALGAVPEDRAGWHESDLVTVVGGSSGEPALLVGVYERGVSFGIVYARESGGEVRVAVELWAETELAPGESLALETVRIGLGTDPSVLLEEYALDYGRRAEARVVRPFVSGWCSWYHAFRHVSEDDVRRNLAALAASHDEVPVEVVQLDDGYQRAVGDWRETNAKFPRGLAPLAEEIRAAGFLPGLWTAPFCAVRESELYGKHPDWLLQQDGEAFQAMYHPDWASDGTVHALDASRPEVTAHLADLFSDLVAMGFRYLKLDFLFVEALAASAWQPGVGRAARLRRGLSAIRDGAGEEAFLLGCGSPLGAAVGLVDGMRVGPDVSPGWLPDPQMRIPDIEQTLPSTRSAIRSVLARVWMHRRLWQNDPDCLLARSADTKLARGEREALAAVIAATGGSFVFSDDLSRLAPEERALLRTALEGAAAVDRSGIPGVARVPDLLEAEIPTRVVATGCAEDLLCFVNASERPLTRAAPGASAQIGPAAEGGRLELAPHTAALLRAERDFSLAVFCDFDGTFSVQDVGATLAELHAPERRPAQWARYERGEITPWQYNLEILDGMSLSVEDLDRFLRGVDLDPGARELLAWCERARVPFRMLSDGFDWNLNRLQAFHQVRFAYTANELRVEDGRWRIRAGAPNPACGCGTGTCKAGVIEAFRAEHPGATLVHVGNGRVSDTCGAIAADAAFAKDSLAVELERRQLPFTAFETLLEVIPVLDAMRADARSSRDAPRAEG